MKAVYCLNQEKLKFNEIVLNERSGVNKKVVDGLRIKKRRFGQTLRKVRIDTKK